MSGAPAANAHSTSADPLAPWMPTADQPFDLPRAGHLLRRAGFGGSLAEREQLVQGGVDAAVEAVCGGRADATLDGMLPQVLQLGGEERLRGWRMLRLLRAPQPLHERMTLCWHGHFATSIRKVTSEALMAAQLRLFDEHGLDRFDDLVLRVARDPAMLRWLDSDANVAGRPNENFARELFELFTLGIGSYTERDVREAARAFTGWRADEQRFRFVRRLHDSGEKVVLGRRGPLSGEDVVALAVQHPACARFVATKLLTWFVHPPPIDDEVAAVARCFDEQQRHVGNTLRVLLRSNLFFGARAYRSRIKGPIDWIVGFVRSLGARAAPLPLGRAAARLGQALLAPPSVEGWHGERAWVTSATWLLRLNFVAELCAGRGGYGLAPAAGEVVPDGSARERADWALRALLDGDVSDAGRAAVQRFAASRAATGTGGSGALLHAVMALPEASLL